MRALKFKLVLTAVAVAALVSYWLYKMHPWMPRGTAVLLGKWTFDKQRFEIWQRKDSLTEPFATGLFINATNSGWRVFCLNIDDYYRPHVELQRQGTRIEIRKSFRLVGNYELDRQVFRKVLNDLNMVSVSITQAPPGTWWVSP